MSNEKTEMPTLVLDGAQEVPAAPTLETVTPSELTQKPEDIEKMNLTPDEQKMVDDFSKKIELTNSNVILQYGSGAQKKVADFSETALNSVKTKDLGEVGDMLSGVVCELKNFQVEDNEKGIMGFFKRSGNKINALKARYAKAETNVDQISSALEGHQVTMLKDIAMLDKMYDLNKVYFKELTMYILAGKKKLQEVQTQQLPVLQKKAQESNLPEDAQAVNDLASMCNRFEKKLYDLELTRTISIQMAPQIRLVQNNDLLMSEKIQSTLVNTIPLWKSQMVLALGVEHSQQAAKAQREVTDMTNELLRKNADTLKMASVNTAKESERGIVDMETLQHTNEQLITTLDEVMQIQKDGHEKRAAAEQELGKIEGELKQKLLSLQTQQ